MSPGKEGKWLQIGEFARRAGVSVKTARYYAGTGLLMPDYIEPSSSYRYYRLDQSPPHDDATFSARRGCTPTNRWERQIAATQRGEF